MKQFALFSLILLHSCCQDTYEPLQYNASPSIQLNLNYRHNGLSSKDTVFNVYYYSYGSPYFYSDYYYAQNLNDSQRSILFTNTNYEKIIFESMTSNFTDSIYNLGYNSKEVKKGSSRCGNSQSKYFNVHATYRGNELNSGEDATLKINVTK